MGTPTSHPRTQERSKAKEEKLNLSVSAKEMRETLDRRRRKDPRREDKGDIKKRFQMAKEL